MSSTDRQERDQVSLELMSWVGNAVTAPVHLQAAGKDIPAAIFHCLPEQGDTSLSLPKGNKAPTLQGTQDSQCPDPNQLQLRTGICQRREHHRTNRGLE